MHHSHLSQERNNTTLSQERNNTKKLKSLGPLVSPSKTRRACSHSQNHSKPIS